MKAILTRRIPIKFFATALVPPSCHTGVAAVLLAADIASLSFHDSKARPRNLAGL
jgi:hypothetical protein